MRRDFNDQAYANLVVQVVGDRFRYVPAWGYWLEYRRGRWEPWGAEEALREAYVAICSEMPENPTGQDFAAARVATGQRAQESVLWLLARDTRMMADPGQFERRRCHLLADRWMTNGEERFLPSPDQYWLRHAPASPFGYEESEELKSLAADCLPLKSERIIPFLSCTRVHESSGVRILLRTDTRSPDLALIARLLSKVYGDYLVCLSDRVWSHWPREVTPELAWMLTGARFIALEGMERYKRFPQESLKRLLTMPEVDYRGHDRRMYRLQVEAKFLLTGPPVHIGAFDAELLELLLPCSWEATR